MSVLTGQSRCNSTDTTTANYAGEWQHSRWSSCLCRFRCRRLRVSSRKLPNS